MLEGHGSDPEGREFALGAYGEGQCKGFPPDLLIVSPERELLGRLPFDASAEATIKMLQKVLRDRPDLAPPVDPVVEHAYNLDDPMQAELAELENRWDSGERATLVNAFEEWISRYENRWSHGSATALTLLGAARYHAGDFAGADHAWTEVVERHPDHPLRNRAIDNLLDKEAWMMPAHPDIRDARHARTGIERPVVLPSLEVRVQNLRRVSSDSRYAITKSGLPLVRIPAGRFVMGGKPPVFYREGPLRRVTISRPFFMAAWPITRGLWRLFRPESVPEFVDPLADQLPVARMSVDDACAFCDYLSSVDGLRYRIPTEAEWEYAARGGIEGAPHPWGHEPVDSSRCNYEHAQGVPVASYPPNGYGLFEMVGNVQEFCADKYLDNAYSLTPNEVTDPTGPSEKDGWDGIPGRNNVYVLRGGYAGLSFCQYMMRNALRLNGRSAGLRVVADAG